MTQRMPWLFRPLRARTLAALASLGLLLVQLAAASLPAAAQGTGAQGTAAQGTAAAAPAAPALDRPDAERLLATLRDPEKRDAFIQTLEAMLRAQGAAPAEPEALLPLPPDSIGAQVLLALSERLGEVSAWLVAAGQALIELPDALSFLWLQLADPTMRAILLRIVGTVVLLFGLGLGAEALAWRLLGRARGVVEGRAADNWLTRAPLMFVRFLLDLVPVASFAAVSYGLISVVDPDPVTRVILLGLNNAYMVSRALLCLARMLLAPGAPQLRLLPWSDETAEYAQLWTRRVTLVGIFGYAVLEAALLLGLGFGAYLALQRLLSLVVALFLVIVVLQNHHQAAAAIRAAPEATGLWAVLRNRLADVWHLLAIGYIAAGWLVVALRIEHGFERLVRVSLLSVLILAAAKGLVTLLKAGIDLLFAISAELRQRYPGLESRANRYVPILRGVLNGVIGFAAVTALLQSWGFNSFDWLANGLGRRLVGSALSIGITVVVALLVWETLNAAIQRQLDRLSKNAAQAGSARVRTLLPMARAALLILIVILVGLIVLSELGVNIAPLLAGAGVVGLAIGFGSQKLVQDIITGIFLLLEDAVSVGDVIQVNGQGGLVEALSIRTIRLRGLDGSVHIIPFSSVNTVTNMTKEFNYALFDLSVAYGEDVDRVIAAIRELGEEMRADPAWAWAVLAPLDVMGLDRFGDSALVIRARFKTVPMQKWNVTREFNKRVKRRFDELGIEIPFPHQKLVFEHGHGPQDLLPPRPAEQTPAPDGPASPAPGPSRA